MSQKEIDRIREKYDQERDRIYKEYHRNVDAGLVIVLCALIIPPIICVIIENLGR